MAVFTALRNKALSTASGFLAKKASSALGLDRAKDIRFNQPSTNPVTGNPQTTRGGEILQYPLNLGSDGNSHFIAFFIKQIDPAEAEITSADGRNKNEQKAKEASQNMGAAGDSDGDEENVKQPTHIVKMIENIPIIFRNNIDNLSNNYTYISHFEY